MIIRFIHSMFKIFVTSEGAAFQCYPPYSNVNFAIDQAAHMAVYFPRSVTVEVIGLDTRHVFRGQVSNPTGASPEP